MHVIGACIDSVKMPATMVAMLTASLFNRFTIMLLE